MTREEQIAAYERGFRRAGLPLLIEHYSATEDVYTRALPVLTLVFVAEVFGALNFDWSPLANVGAFAGGVAIFLAAFGLVNRSQNRPFLSIPQRVGYPELAAFVVVPGLLPLVFGGQLESGFVTMAGNIALLVVVSLIVGYGLVAILAWAGRRLFSQLGSSLALLTKALPLLMVFSLLLFLTTEVWQVFSTIPAAFLALVFALLGVLGVGFLISRLPREVAELERETAEGPPLTRNQRFNVALVMFVSQGLQVLLVSVAIGLFFVAFGALAVSAAVERLWIGTAGHLLLHFDLFGHPVRVTRELLRVSGGLAAVSGLYYAIATLTDATYREEFLAEITGGMRETFAARAEYLRLLARSGGR